MERRLRQPGSGRPSARRASGIAAVLVLIALAVAATLSLTFMATQSTTMGVAENIDRQSRARAIAESAVSLVMADVNRTSDWRTHYTHGQFTAARALGDGTYQVRIDDGWDLDGDGEADGDGDLADDASDDFTLTTRGDVDGVTHMCRVRVDTTLLRGKALMVIKDIKYKEPLNFVAGEITVARDTRLRAMIESLGWIVEPILETAPTSALLSAASQNDVILISGGTWHDNVLNDLRDTAKGAVSNEYGLMKDWGFMSSDPSGWIPPASQSKVKITQTHEVTPWPVNTTIQFVKNAQPVWLMNASMASQAEVLAKIDNTPAIAIFEQGNLDKNNRTVHGRRVILPWSMWAEPAQLTEQGRELYSNALSWAAKPPAAAGTFGVGATETISVTGGSIIRGRNSSTGASGKASVATNRKASSSIVVNNGGKIEGDVMVGNGANLNSAISANPSNSITGTKAAFAANKSLSIVPAVVPPGLPANATNWNGGTDLSGTYRFTSMNVGGGKTLRISGRTIIWCNGSFTLGNGASIVLEPDAELLLYADSFTINGGGLINWTDPRQPARVSMFQLGNNKNFVINNGAMVAAAVSAANGNLQLGGGTELFGTFEGKSVSLSNGAILTHDLSMKSVGVGGASGGASEPEYKYNVIWMN